MGRLAIIEFVTATSMAKGARRPRPHVESRGWPKTDATPSRDPQVERPGPVGAFRVPATAEFHSGCRCSPYRAAVASRIPGLTPGLLQEDSAESRPLSEIFPGDPSAVVQDICISRAKRSTCDLFVHLSHRLQILEKILVDRFWDNLYLKRVCPVGLVDGPRRRY